MLDRWQRFACFETIDMLLDQTSARWTNHPSCRRLHKIPAHTVKERGSRPQRLPPCAPTFPSLRAAHYSRLFRFVNTLFRGPPHRSGRCCRCCFVVATRRSFRRSEPPIMSGFSFPSTPFVRSSRSSVVAPLVSLKPLVGDPCDGGGKVCPYSRPL
jgi:hypothetical protein